MTQPGPTLAIRADASHHGGTGHVLRTLAVAEEWIRRGGNVVYLSAELPPPLADRLRNARCDLDMIKADDARETARLAEQHRASILLVDHYRLGDDWWPALPAERSFRTAGLNDFKDPIHSAADILISPRAKALPWNAHPASFGGPGFFLLRSDLRSEEPSRPPARARNILLLLGGADPRNIAPATAAMISECAPRATVRAIVGPAARNEADLRGLAEQLSHLEVIIDPPDLAAHYRWADTAVVSPSTTASEVLHHGLVTGLVMTVNNQEEVAAGLIAQDTAVLLADARRTGYSFSDEALQTILSNRSRRRALAANGRDLIDGFGAARTCDVLGLPDLDFRPVTFDDAELLHEWANDPETRSASFSPDAITLDEHLAWLEARLATPDPFWIAIPRPRDDSPLAVVRFDDKGDDIAVISLNLAPAWRRKRLAALVIHRACQRFRLDHPRCAIHAWIRNTNSPSQKAFQRAGFHPDPGSSPPPDRQLLVLPP